MTHPSVVVEGLGKRFRRYQADRPTTLMEAALAGWRRLQPIDQFWALQDISFTVASGQMLGILGHNGAGKSTLLQLIGGVGCPDAGCIKTRGRIGALLDLGAGFHTDLTGRENVLVTAISNGMTRQEVERRLGAIIEFAELEAFIDSPLRTYSTGMQMRLAFSVAVHSSPDILLIDEHLSVGDLAFQNKCLERITQLKARGCAIVLISQSAEQVQSLCDRALWLDRGKMVALGDPHTISGQYASKMDAKLLPKPEQRYSQEVEILAVSCLNSRQQTVTELETGNPLTIVIRYCVHTPVSAYIFNVSIGNEEGHIYFNTHTANEELSLPLTPSSGQISLKLARLDLSGGQYYINVGVFSANWQRIYDYHWQKSPLKLHCNLHEGSILSPPRAWEISNSSQNFSYPSITR